MPLLIGVLVLAAALVWWFRRRRSAKGMPQAGARPRLPCRWRATGQDSGALRGYRCRRCGETAYSARREGPAACRQGLSRGGL